MCVETLHDIVITADDEPTDSALIGTEKQYVTWICQFDAWKYNKTLGFRLLSLELGEAENEEEATEQDRRVKMYNESDPVSCVELKRSVFLQLDFLQSQLGATNFERLMQKVDPDIRTQLMSFN